MFGTRWLHTGDADVSVPSLRLVALVRGAAFVSVGAKLGKRFYVMPELTFGWVLWHSRRQYAVRGDPDLVFGLAFHNQFGRLAYFDERSGVPGLHP